MSAQEPKDVAKLVYEELRKRQGRDEAITAPALAELLSQRHDDTQIDERQVRRVIASHSQQWAEQGLVLVGVPGSGFHAATEVEELSAYYRYLIALRCQAADKVMRFECTLKKAGFGGLIERKKGDFSH